MSECLGFGSLDIYMFKSEDFLLTSYAPSPFPSPRWGEGGGEGKISNIIGLFIIIN